MPRHLPELHDVELTNYQRGQLIRQRGGCVCPFGASKGDIYTGACNVCTEFASDEELGKLSEQFFKQITADDPARPPAGEYESLCHILQMFNERQPQE